jgi:hypothetical protein
VGGQSHCAGSGHSVLKYGEAAFKTPLQNCVQLKQTVEAWNAKPPSTFFNSLYSNSYKRILNAASPYFKKASIKKALLHNRAFKV